MKWQKYILVAIPLAISVLISAAAQAQQQPQRPNILVIWDDDIGLSNISVACSNSERTQERIMTEMDLRVPFLRAELALQLVLGQDKIAAGALSVMMASFAMTYADQKI